MTEEKFDLILTILEEITEKINLLNAKSSEEKGSEVGSARQTELKVKEEIIEKKTRRKVMKIAKKPCNRCGGRISWDDYDENNEGVQRPLHVDQDGYVIGGCK